MSQVNLKFHQVAHYGSLKALEIYLKRFKSGQERSSSFQERSCFTDVAGGSAIHCRLRVISNSTPRQCGRRGSLLFEILQFHELNLKGKERGHDQNGEIRVQSARCHMPQCPYTHTVKQLLVRHPSSCIDLMHRLSFNFASTVASTAPQPPLTTPFRPPNTQRLMPQVLASMTHLSTRVMRIRLKTSPSDSLPEPCEP